MDGEGRIREVSDGHLEGNRAVRLRSIASYQCQCLGWSRRWRSGSSRPLGRSRDSESRSRGRKDRKVHVRLSSFTGGRERERLKEKQVCACANVGNEYRGGWEAVAQSEREFPSDGGLAERLRFSADPIYPPGNNLGLMGSQPDLSHT